MNEILNDEKYYLFSFENKTIPQIDNYLASGMKYMLMISYKRINFGKYTLRINPIVQYGVNSGLDTSVTITELKDILYDRELEINAEYIHDISNLRSNVPNCKITAYRFLVELINQINMVDLNQLKRDTDEFIRLKNPLIIHGQSSKQRRGYGFTGDMPGTFYGDTMCFGVVGVKCTVIRNYTLEERVFLAYKEMIEYDGKYLGLMIGELCSVLQSYSYNRDEIESSYLEYLYSRFLDKWYEGEYRDPSKELYESVIEVCKQAINETHYVFID